MTLNLVLKARTDHATEGDGTATACAGIARRWLATEEFALTGAELADRLTVRRRPAGLVRPENIDRIETNLQIAHAPKSAMRDFRTDYLLKVFVTIRKAGSFVEAPLENQIDRDRILADENLKRDFRAWLLDPVHFGELDRGTILIPDKFLAIGAIAATPVGFAPSDLQPAFGMVQGEERSDPAFSESDVVAALKKVAEHGVGLQNIRSPAGFARRLNDITCSGAIRPAASAAFIFPASTG